MTKTPDETKKGLECCMDYQNCTEGEDPQCPYYDVKRCMEALLADALALIQQLQAENAEKDARIQQLEAERDAAVETIYEMEKCITDACEWCDGVECERLCMMHLTERPGFKWRGVQKEE